MKKNQKFFNLKSCPGFSLVEMLVVISVMGLIVLVGSNLFLGSLRGTSKSDVLLAVRQNGGYALGAIEEMIKNSYGLVSCTQDSISVKDANSQEVVFNLVNDVNGIPRIASNGSYLTSNKVKVLNFLVDCSQVQPGISSKIGLSFLVQQVEETQSPERSASMEFATTVTIRNFYQESLD